MRYEFGGLRGLYMEGLTLSPFARCKLEPSPLALKTKNKGMRSGTDESEVSEFSYKDISKLLRSRVNQIRPS